MALDARDFSAHPSRLFVVADGLRDDGGAHDDPAQQVAQVVRDHAEEVVAIGDGAIGAHALGVQVFVGLFAFGGQEPGEDPRGFGTLDLERLIRGLAVGEQDRVLDVAFAATAIAAAAGP